MAVTSQPTPAVAYSYVRFSSPEQAKGDSLRRQTELRDAWLARTGVRLDTTLSLRDEGVSAFSGAHRENPDRNALAGFLELVRRGRIPRGSFLIVESLDRLTREHIRPALTLILNLIESGIRIVQLLPAEAIYDEQVEPMSLMQAIMELSRGHSESRMKSERLGRAWNEKRKAARANGKPLTRSVPSWVRVSGDRMELIPERAAVVQRIYREVIAGHGLVMITKRLNSEGVPPIARGTSWVNTYIHKLIVSRATVGEYQPHRHAWPDRKPDGPPIPDYFPRVVSDADWHAAQASLASRRGKSGAVGKRIWVFSGLLRDARGGGKLNIMYKGGKKSPAPVLASCDALQGVTGAKYVSFPAAVFERALLEKLREIDPRDILPRDDPAADRVLVLAGMLAQKEGRKAQLEASITEGDGDIPPILAALRKLEEEVRTISGELARARQEASSPLGESWGSVASLAEAMEAMPDQAEARVRLRAAIRRIVSGVWALFVARGRCRLAWVRVQFAGVENHRDYVILHTPNHSNGQAKRPATTLVKSFAGVGEFDLRKSNDAAQVESILLALPIDQT